MNEKQNFDTLFCAELQRIAQSPTFAEKKPRLLLHACCAPCSSAVLERLAGYFDVTVFYYNPNIHPQAEYTRRLDELAFFLARRTSYGTEAEIRLIRTEYKPEEFFSAVDVERVPSRALEPERSERCFLCYRLRMEKTAFYAQQNGFDYFTAALSISPHKDAGKINALGAAIEKKLNAEPVCASAAAPNSGKPLRYLYADFKKRDGYKRSLELSAEYGLYRQDYCGCIYSRRNTELLRRERLNAVVGIDTIKKNG